MSGLVSFEDGLKLMANVGSCGVMGLSIESCWNAFGVQYLLLVTISNVTGLLL